MRPLAQAMQTPRQKPRTRKAATADDSPMLLTVEQAARKLGVSRRVLYPHVMDGTLPSVVIGSKERKVLAFALPHFLRILCERQGVTLDAYDLMAG